ncbi:MAG: mandelate racemase/muconate lactonizing enzyme family protein [Candidatus Nanopelagicales bacterium]|nr:mandelate racemase/muconate lactonizing enzyme family protein [Candidatus Nanopelagicales bacterium]MCF8536374.1 mandelate racemase/muconate lactonizing enzyme family protein [Candidatus Nanopelagicales bacterium]MCF8541546.1 mandelate racemase/muconate lactonizing enzyme family protein [Candidatus Nanopelagicales bacterium]MCF8556535.1 mandelate racemase/muconate lactonizing enzyme family protein [Candidatus Nanopelagicales bacterium]
MTTGHEIGATHFADDHGGLSITGITTTPVIAPLVREFKGSYYHMTNRATLVIRLTTSDGIVGEAYVGDEDKSLPELEAIIHKEILPRIRGLNALRTEQVWARSFPATFDILRDRRLGLVALAAVDTAVWDAVGKALGQPLWRLWGGYRNTIEMIAIGGYYGEPLGSIHDEIGFYKEAGLAGIKFKVGGRTPQEDAERVLAARAAAGDDWVIAIDANQGYTVNEAIDLCRRIEGAGIRWFEEPVQWMNDKRALRDVRAIGGIPVCAGQSEFSSSGCRDLMETGSVDVCNFDASWSGGPTAWRRTAAIAHAYDVEMGHHEEPQVSTHLLTSISHGTYAECFHPDRDPFWWNMILNRPPLVDGSLTLSDAPGFGWELNQDYIDKWTVR